MFSPNSTKSVFWLIVILAVVGIAVAFFLRKSNAKTNATPSGDSAVKPNTDPGADSDTEDPDAAPAEGE